MTAEAASLAVGYASPSQFNREFKRLFARAAGGRGGADAAQFRAATSASGCGVRVFALRGSKARRWRAGR
jgi:AraC-like DNA-binding protein